MRQSRAPHSALIFPLDVHRDEDARIWVRRLSTSVGMFKIGLELFIRSGPDIVRWVRDESDAGIFLDLKLYDIPATVRHAMASMAELGASMATVHCGENPRMLEAAVEGAAGRTRVLAVTVLTSVSSQHLTKAGYLESLARDPTRLVVQRAQSAKAAGCDGVICSGREVAAIKQACGDDFLAVTPGIRPAFSIAGSDEDQERVSTPASAIAGGADYLVVGRPIRDAEDPREAVSRIVAEIASAM
ncbi:MAG: orotidine-5'-phosphate decarboxylase [Desulfobacteraceae bacterium]|nr:orotidine-5'-phosphate decarboxylase [Desulfobacteraceae bacterium]